MIEGNMFFPFSICHVGSRHQTKHIGKCLELAVESCQMSLYSNGEHSRDMSVVVAFSAA